MSNRIDAILLAEDDPNDVLLMRHVFNKLNLASLLQVVNDGEQAVDYLQGKGAYENRDRYPLPALLLLDLKMPRKSGFEVIEWIRQQPALKRLPIIVLTSSRETNDINRAYDLGANSYVAKVGKQEALLDLVKNLNQYWGLINEKPNIHSA